MMTGKEFLSCLCAGLIGSGIIILVLFCLINIGFTAIFFLFPESDPEEQISFLEALPRFIRLWPFLLAGTATFSLPVFVSAFFTCRALLRNKVNNYTKFDYVFTRSIIIGCIMSVLAILAAYLFPALQIPLSDAFAAFLMIPVYLPFFILAARFTKKPSPL